MLILDGGSLAARRAAILRERADTVRAARGHAPRLLIVAFADDSGRMPWVERKVRAAAAAGIDVSMVAVQAGTAAAAAVDALEAHIDGAPAVDGVFVQVPFPDDFDDALLTRAIPVELDVDVMTDAATAAFMADPAALPPVTVSAALLLLDEYGVSVNGVVGSVVAGDSAFAEMFRVSLERRGARMQPLLAPDTPDLAARLGDTQLVVVAAGRPGVLPASALAEGTVAIDVGYFNPGGCGDIDVSGGVEHLAALAPVPGGIGPMTVSALLERVVMTAEARGSTPVVERRVER